MVISGGVLLFLGGLLHSYGYTMVGPKFAAALQSTPQLLGIVHAMWLAFGVEFVLLGLIILWAVRLPASRGLILLCGLIPALTGILMFHFIGAFIGDIIFAVSAALVLIGGWMLPRARESHPASRMW